MTDINTEVATSDSAIQDVASTSTESTETTTNEVSASEVEVSQQSRAERLAQLEEGFHNRNSEPVVETAETEEVTEPEEVVAEPEETKTDDGGAFTKRFAQLAKREAALRTREDKLKSAGTDAEDIAKFRELQSLAKSNPLKVAQSLGIDLGDLADQAINEDQFTEKNEYQAMKDRLQKLEKMNEEADISTKKRRQEDQAQQYIDNINDNINQNADDYPLVTKLNGGRQLVINTISEYYQQSGEELSWKKAADMTEDYLMDQKIKEYTTLTSIKKVRGKLGLSDINPTPTSTSTTSEPKVTTKSKQVQPGLRTLSNQTVSAPSDREVGKVSREERQRRIDELADSLFG